MKKILNFIFIFNVLVLEKSNSGEGNMSFRIKLFECNSDNFDKNSFDKNGFDKKYVKSEKSRLLDSTEINKNNIRGQSQEKPDFNIIKPLRKGSDQVKKNDLNLKENVPFLDLLQKKNNNLIIRSGSPLKNNKGPVKSK